MQNILANCTFDLTSDGETMDDRIEETSVYLHETTISIQYVTDNADGFVHTTVTCQNHVSSKQEVLQVILREPISGGELTAAQEAFETYTQAECFVLRLSVVFPLLHAGFHAIWFSFGIVQCDGKY